jgi:hypothetical protein
MNVLSNQITITNTDKGAIYGYDLRNNTLGIYTKNAKNQYLLENGVHIGENTITFLKSRKYTIHFELMPNAEKNIDKVSAIKRVICREYHKENERCIMICIFDHLASTISLRKNKEQITYKNDEYYSDWKGSFYKSRFNGELSDIDNYTDLVIDCPPVNMHTKMLKEKKYLSNYHSLLSIMAKYKQ